MVHLSFQVSVMNEIKTGDKVVDSTGSINSGLPIQVTKIEGSKVTVEFYEGEEAIHRVLVVDLARLHSSN